MPKCPNCSEEYTPGELLCPNCKHDLSPIEISGGESDTKQGSGIQYYCDPSQMVDGWPGCGYIGEFEDGHTCPRDGAYWENPVPAPSGTPPNAAPPQPPPGPTPQTPAQPASPEASPESPQPMPPEPGPHLVIEGNQTVTWLNKEVGTIPFDTDEISLGCRDTTQGHYPDIDLLRYRRNDPFLSRRQGRFIREGTKYYIEVYSDAESTTINGTDDIIEHGPDKRRELNIGDRVFLSDSIVIRFEA